MLRFRLNLYYLRHKTSLFGDINCIFFLFHNDVTFGFLNSLFCWLIAKEGEREREREDKIDAPTSILICLCVSMRDLSFCEVIKKL